MCTKIQLETLPGEALGVPSQTPLGMTIEWDTKKTVIRKLGGFVEADSWMGFETGVAMGKGTEYCSSGLGNTNN